MDIWFPGQKVRDLYCCRASLDRAFGAELARLICCRLSVLAAAPSLSDVPTSPPIELAASRKAGTFSVALGAENRLQFRATIPKMARADDLSSVTEIQVTGLISVPTARGE